MPEFLPEVFVSNKALASQVSKKMKAGQLRKLGSRVYTTNLQENAEVLIRRHIWFILETLFPYSIVADRTALEHQPAKDGSIFIISKKKRSIALPGIIIYPRKGEGPLPEDQPFMEKLFFSCPARAYLENIRVSRSKKGRISRTLSREELEDKLEDFLRSSGVAAFQKLRDEARRLAPTLGTQKEFKILDQLMGALLGTRDMHLTSQKAYARSQGEPYDPKRLDLFQALYQALASQSTEPCTTFGKGYVLAFFEAYFSNFIEGTEFEVEEAAKIIFEGKIPENRPADAHDVLGTYRLVSDDREMKKTPEDPEEFLLLLKKRHACLMQGRPDMHPGEFKKIANRAGSTLFVAPELVEGTLKKGFQWFKGLDTPFKKAVYMMFLVTEVHPFSDGNGRCARIMMNAELIAQGQARIIIPTIFRNTYLAALKALSHNAQTIPLIRCLNFLQKYTSQINWEDTSKAQEMLTRTHAFKDSTEAEYLGVRLILPHEMGS